MAQKTIKKSRKTVARRAAKPTTKRTVRAVEPVAQMHECNCGCAHKCCCHGHRLIGLCIKIILLCMVFLAGAVSAPWLMRGAHKSMMRHIQFDDNGCVMLESIKCPKLLERLATADDDANGCISRAELKTALRDMHHAPIDAESNVDFVVE